jgi:hypothetical protein
MADRDQGSPRAVSGPTAAVRASDAEREAVVARLAQAVGEGRLTADEAGERIAAVYNTRLRAELHSPLADLPVTQSPATGAPSWGELWAQLLWRARVVVDGPGTGRPTPAQQRAVALLVGLAVLWTTIWVVLGAIVA